MRWNISTRKCTNRIHRQAEHTKMADPTSYTNDHRCGIESAARRSRRARGWSAAVVACAAATLVFVHPVRAAAPDSGAPIVKTRTGAVRGTVDGNVRVFLGIPYAAPPVGNLRWQPPAAHASWTDTLDASRAGNSCTQMSFRHQRARGLGGLPLSQCLHAEDPAAARLPVMVWIHGGTFIVGAGATYNGSKLSCQGQPDRRHDQLSARAFRLSGQPQPRFGDPAILRQLRLLDQQAALRWVRTISRPSAATRIRSRLRASRRARSASDCIWCRPRRPDSLRARSLKAVRFVRARTLAERERAVTSSRPNSDATRHRTSPDACARNTADRCWRDTRQSPRCRGPAWAPTVDGEPYSDSARRRDRGRTFQQGRNHERIQSRRRRRCCSRSRNR